MNSRGSPHFGFLITGLASRQPFLEPAQELPPKATKHSMDKYSARSPWMTEISTIPASLSPYLRRRRPRSTLRKLIQLSNWLSNDMYCGSMYTINDCSVPENGVTSRCTSRETVSTERLFSALRWATASPSMLIGISNT